MVSNVAGPVEQIILQKLTSTFNPIHIEIQNDSHKHASHTAMRDVQSKETHFNVFVVSAAFEGT